MLEVSVKKVFNRKVRKEKPQRTQGNTVKKRNKRLINNQLRPLRRPLLTLRLNLLNRRCEPCG